MKPIEFHDVYKKFRKGEKFDSFRDFIPSVLKNLFIPKKKGELLDKEFWVLKGVSFEVNKGEVIGIIGSNGAGKSTILKLLSGILKPTSGEIKIRGKLSALIEVGAGFHEDLTGRENIYLNAAIMGLKKKEVDKKFDSIVEFSELIEFIDTPVKRYSSGMYARLGFSVAAHMDPDILLVDEVLSVGDISFQSKCIEKIMELKNKGVTIVFISHNMEALLSICSRTILLDKGTILLEGPTDKVVREYQSNSIKHMVHEVKGDNSKPLTIKKVSFINTEGQESFAFNMGDKLVLRVVLESRKPISAPVIGIAFYNEKGVCLYGHNSKEDRCVIGDIQGDYQIEIEYPDISFLPGVYSLTVAIYNTACLILYDISDRQYKFVINGKKGELGVVNVPHAWKSFGKS